MRVLGFFLALLVLPLQAEEPALRASAGLLFKYPELLRPGSCVTYREGGAGWILREPLYYLRGTVTTAEVTTRRLERCPELPGKTREQYTRDEYVRLMRAMPCLANASAPREEQVGMVRLQVIDWETPHVRKAENAGRLYRGMFLDQPLKKGLEVELEADLLGPCS
jgi:hypothetical protein